MALVDAIGGAVRGALGWGGAMATEVLLLPATLRDLRGGVAAIVALPGAIERLHASLTAATDTLDEHLPVVAAVATDELAPGLAALRDRLERTHALAASLAASADPVLAKADRLLDRAPDQLANVEAAVVAVDERVATLWPQLDRLLPQLDALLPSLRRLEVAELQDRVRHLDEIVGDLAETLTAVLGSIPGVRRTVNGS